MMARLFSLLWASTVLLHRLSHACSSDACETFDSYESLVERVRLSQEQEDSDGPITVCMCGQAFRDDLCPPVDLDNGGGPTMGIWRTGRIVSLRCAGLYENCALDCPGSSVRVETGGSLELIGFKGNLEFSNTAQPELSSKVAVEPGGTLFVSGVVFRNIMSDEDQWRSGTVGGGIANAGDATVLDSSFVNCFAGARGGAIATAAGSLLDVRRTSFAENAAPVGGAVYVSRVADEVRIYDSTFSRVPFSRLFGDDGGALDAAASANNLTRDSDDSDSVSYSGTAETLEFCGNDGLEDIGCSGSGSAELVFSAQGLWMVLSLVGLGSAAFL